MSRPIATSVLSRFPGLRTIGQLTPLDNAGGFSGSKLWKVTADDGEFCLRRWPEETTAERLTFIHAFQRHLSVTGLGFVPALIDASGGTFVEQEGHFWELASWMPGTADYRAHPTAARLTAAMKDLAQVHIAAAQMPGQSRSGTSPGLASRLDQMRQLRAGGIERIEAAVARRPLAWDDLARRICAKFRQHAPGVEYRLTEATTISGPLFPCLRDIWHDHVLFTGDDVTGIIDFGAARVESPAGDIARLVGSLVDDEAEGWRAALSAYKVFGPISASQHQLMRAFDASGVLLSGINWLTWLYVEEREFDDASAVTRRLTKIVVRLDGKAF